MQDYDIDFVAQNILENFKKNLSVDKLISNIKQEDEHAYLLCSCLINRIDKLNTEEYSKDIIEDAIINIVCLEEELKPSISLILENCDFETFKGLEPIAFIMKNNFSLKHNYAELYVKNYINKNFGYERQKEIINEIEKAYNNLIN